MASLWNLLCCAVTVSVLGVSIPDLGVFNPDFGVYILTISLSLEVLYWC